MGICAEKLINEFTAIIEDIKNQLLQVGNTYWPGKKIVIATEHNALDAETGDNIYVKTGFFSRDILLISALFDLQEISRGELKTIKITVYKKEIYYPFLSAIAKYKKKYDIMIKTKF